MNFEWLSIAAGSKRSPLHGSPRGFCMSPEDLAVLKSLAIRPSLSIAPGLQQAVARLQGAGYISHGPSGWMATAKGCELVEAREPALM